MRPPIQDFFADPQLLNMGFLSPAQLAYLKGIYGEKLTAAEDEAFREYVDTERRPEGYREIVGICGARSGKSHIAAGVSLYECLFGGHERFLKPGETGTFVVIASNKKQGRIIFNYAHGMVRESPMLSTMLAKEPTSDELHFTNQTCISTWPCNRVSVRGLSIIGADLDEIAWWRLESDSPSQDVEVCRAVKRGMIQFPDSRLFMVSNPYLKAGVLYKHFKNRMDAPETLVFKAPSWEMNPSLSKAEIDKEFVKDPEMAAREYGAEFSNSVSAFLSGEAIDACVISGRRELPPIAGVRYRAALDSGYIGDRFVFGIGHAGENKTQVIDLFRTWQGSRKNPVQIAQVAAEIKELQKRYHFTSITGDQYASELLRQVFAEHGLRLEEKTFTSKSKMVIFSRLRAGINAGLVELLDHRESLKELRAFEVRLTSGGNVQFSHPERGGLHDDHVDTLALLVDATASSGECVMMLRTPPSALEQSFMRSGLDRFQ